MPKIILRLASAIMALLWISACSQGPASLPTSTPAAQDVEPTPTIDSSSLAALVGSEPITLVEYENELARFEADQTASGTDLATLGDYQGQLLQAMIDRLLLAQGAKAAGFEIDELAVMERLGGEILQIGGTDRFEAWMQANYYSLETLIAALTQEILAAQMVERIVSEVPLTAEQVHASHILVADRDTADFLYQQIIAGSDFATLAELNSTDTSTRLSGGDLGWFSPGTLTMPEVEEAAFALQPGEVSQPIESLLGYHIVQCIERGEYPLSPQALQRQREKAVMDWLSDQRESVAIQVFITP